jgi:hypothetical protein
MAARKQSAARIRLRNKIIDTQKSFRTSPKPPEVIGRFMIRHWSALYRDDEDIVREGFMEGLGRLVRAEMHAMGILRHGEALPGDPSDADEPTQLMLDLWAEDERDIAREIGVLSFYIPSRGTYVALHDPKVISDGELAEGIEHLRKYARSLDHRADWGQRLRDHRRAKQAGR